MNNRSVVLWFTAGIPIAVVDGWLSVQSLFGLISPVNIFGYLVAISMGVLLTVFAVYVPILRGERTSPALVLIWVGAFSVDMITSIVGAIWYGVLQNPLNSTIDVSELTFEPANWSVTLLFVAFVLIVAFCCFKFGQALNELNRRQRVRSRAPSRG